MKTKQFNKQHYQNSGKIGKTHINQAKLQQNSGNKDETR